MQEHAHAEQIEANLTVLDHAITLAYPTLGLLNYPEFIASNNTSCATCMNKVGSTKQINAITTA